MRRFRAQNVFNSNINLFGDSKMKTIFFIFLCVVITGCSSLEQKSWTIASSADAFKISVADSKNGNFTPEIIAGGGANAAAFQKAYSKDERATPVISYSRRFSLWGIFKRDTHSGNVSFSYIGGSDESPDQTAEILRGVSGIVNHKEVEK